VDLPCSRARRFTGLSQRGREAGSMSMSHSLIIENGDKASNCQEIITFFSTHLSQTSVDVFKKVNFL
jgi:hypothetical protein